ncbi:endonuclease NucS (plasmid) [Rhizobium leguminosarum]|nr:endonuclease NucS [Rhizobium leguminosarum]UIK14603.1 endonuclease NucS [Rhizobium leguminosarum]
MRDDEKCSRDKPVLGLFKDESELRDYLESNLHLIEPGLRLLAKEHVLENPEGSGGRVDILARDAFGHNVCIEIKRSDASARSALNELSKYIALLVERDRLQPEMIRCVVVSTHWKELRLPLSYFAQSVGVDVMALEAKRDGSRVYLEPVEMIDIKFLKQLSPDMDLIWFDTERPRQRYVEFLRARATSLPFVRLAVLLFERRLDASIALTPYPMMICVWRIKDGLYEKIEDVIGKPIGHDLPYAAPGWEPEADAKNWIDDAPFTSFPEVSVGWTHGTPEKLSSLVPNYDLQRIERIGDWPKVDLINDDETILEMAQATSPLRGSGRLSRHRFQVTVSPRFGPSWRLATASFLEFIAFEKSWVDQAQDFIDQIVEDDVAVELHAFDKKHLIFAIHQARFHYETMFSFFEIAVRKGDAIVSGMCGQYSWDGTTCPSDADAVIHEIYGGIMHARVAIGSAVDDHRYEKGLALHGFVPVFDWVKDDRISHSSLPATRYPLQSFVAANPAYSSKVSAALERVGPLPTGSAS